MCDATQVESEIVIICTPRERLRVWSLKDFGLRQYSVAETGRTELRG
jgi:hypothetical protein